MLLNITLLFWLFNATPLQAEPPPPPPVKSLCAPCLNGTRNVRIFVKSREIPNNLYNQLDEETWYHPTTGGIGAVKREFLPEGGSFEVGTVEELAGVFRDVSGHCDRIKYLGMDAHGELGRVILNGSAHVLDVTTFGKLKGWDCAMADHAKIEFISCSLGAGCRGEDFLIGLAGTLLKSGGGSIHANTYLATGIPLLFPSTSLNGDTQILTVESGMTHLEWDNTPQTPQACKKRADDAIAALNDLSRKLTSCPAAQGFAFVVESTRNEMQTVANDELNYGSSRSVYFEGRDERAARFAKAFRLYYEDVLATAKSQLARCGK